MLSAKVMLRRFSFAVALPALSLASCATPDSDRYPSLGIRDVERAQGQFEPVPAEPLAVPPVEIPLDGPLDDRLAALREAATASHRAFTAAAPAATRAANAAAGSATGSTAWAAAQVALADLDSARSMTAIALGDLDTLMVSRAVQGEDLRAVEAVRQEVLEVLGEEDRTLAELRGKVA